MNNVMWFLLACFFIMLEIGHPGLLYFMALASGSSAAFIVSWLGYSQNIQYIVFFIASIIAIGLVYLLVRKFEIRSVGSHRSNTDLLIGKIVIVTEVQSATIGQGKLGGETWLIKIHENGELKIGMEVIVVNVQGCHLQVREFIHNK